MKDLFQISDKNYLITGGTGTLGGSIAQYLVENNANVILLGRTQEKLEAKKIELNALKKGKAYIYKTDVMDATALKILKAEIKKEFKVIDGLINLAGGNIPGATVKPDQTIFDISIEDTQEAINLNTYGTLIPTLVFSEIMADQGFGSIINISSMASKQAISRVLGYSMAKASIDIFTKWLANELASKFTDKVRVNAIAPGFFIGNQNRKLLTNEDGSFTERGDKIINNTPMARFGDASELNGMVHYLLSEASSFVTASVFEVDGGFSNFSGV